MLKNPSNSLRSSVSSINSDRGSRPKVNFIEKNKMNLKKKLDSQSENLIQITCLNDVENVQPSPTSSIEIFEEIETIETNDPGFLSQGDQFDTQEDQLHITKSEFFDRNKLRSEINQKFKKREIIPTVIDSGYSETNSLENFTHKIQSNLDVKLNAVMKQIEILKQYEDNLIPRLVEKKNEPDQDRLRHLELVQENQFKLMSQLIDKMKPLAAESLSSTSEPRVKTIQFNDTVQVIEPKKRSKSKSRSRSRSKAIDVKSSCEVCDTRVKSKSPVRSKSPKKEKKFLQELIDTLPKSPNSSFKQVEEEKPSLFDEYLKKESLSDILKQSNELLGELERQEELNRKIKQELANKVKPSMFSDIKEVMKKVEESKKKIDTAISELNRKKNTKMFYLLNDGNEMNDELRIKKLVDGCISAISNDVQKVVTQKMIDESKHIKLEAERDVNSFKNRQLRQNQRSVSTSNLGGPKPKQISDVHKYLGKIYGKSLLEQIKKEQVDEKNQRLRDEAEKRKKQRELEQANKNKPQKPVQKIKNPPINRPAFITSPLGAYPDNLIKNFKQVKSVENIGVVHILPREKSPSGMTLQKLPSMSINPASSRPKSNVKHVDIVVDQTLNESVKDDKRSVRDSFEDEQGVGINIRGQKRTENETNYEDRPLPVPGDMSSQNQKYLIDRALSENRVLDWLEQEILKNFLNRLEVEDDSSEAENLDDNIRLLVDVGQEIDPNLIECLAQEVLNEKISAMIFRQMEEEDNGERVQPQPTVTPRKTIEFLDSQREKSFVIEVSTPKTTPPHSPRLKKEEVPVEPVRPSQPTQREQEIQIVQFINDEETESVLELTLEESEDEGRFDEEANTRSVFLPPTPRETPQPTPEPIETPSVSEKTPPPPPPVPEPKVLPPVKQLVNSSVQCDPEPKQKPIVQPPPVVVEKPKKDVSVSEMTESTSTFTSDTSTTIESDKTMSDSDSYFSDGAWLMSKSEGEIVKFDHNNYVNLDLEAASRGMILNPRSKKSDTTSQSEGEIQLDRLNNHNLNAYAGLKARPGVNQIKMSNEVGEVFVRRNSDKSEGEVENPGSNLINKKIEQINESIKIKSKSKSKKVVSLSVSPEKSNTKNNIKIKPIVNEVIVRDSNDFERKIFSSTPDTSLFLSNQLASSNQILADSYGFDNSSFKKFQNKDKNNSVLISTDFNTTKFEDEDDDTLNNTSDLDEHN